MSTNNNSLTLMTVHAHPDDEVVFTGGVLAQYHKQGVTTVLVTATNGEEGEIHDPDLTEEEARPRLGEIRREELRKAAEILAVDHLEMLGYRDSGMAGTEANANPGNFHNADREEATARLVQLIRRYKPQVLVTYDENGAYGHPDHIACNVITRAAYEKAGDPSYHPDPSLLSGQALGEPWEPAKLYYTHWPEDLWEKAHALYKERGLKWPWDEEEQERQEDPEHKSDEEGIAEYEEKAEEAKEEGKPPAYVPPPVTARINVADALQQKREAVMVHRTQFSPEGAFTNMPEDIGSLVFGEEHFSLVKSRVPVPETETDLFSGIE